MIDLHCHILWNIDDGPTDFAGALDMARIAAADGTRQLVATPHVGRILHPPALIAEKVARLNRALCETNIDLEVFSGSDNLYNLEVETLAGYSINNTRYVLMEFPHTHLPADAGERIFAALPHGLKPIITHPERNPSIIQQPQLLFDLVDRGALVQLTAESLTDGFGAAVKACSRYLMKKKMVHFLASDGHSVNWRPPTLSAGLNAATRIIGKEAARMLVFENPLKVINGVEMG